MRRLDRAHRRRRIDDSRLAALDLIYRPTRSRPAALSDDSVDAGAIQNSSVNTDKIAAGAFRSSELGTDAPGTDHIAAGPVGTSESPRTLTTAILPPTHTPPELESASAADDRDAAKDVAEMIGSFGV